MSDSWALGLGGGALLAWRAMMVRWADHLEGPLVGRQKVLAKSAKQRTRAARLKSRYRIALSLGGVGGGEQTDWRHCAEHELSAAHSSRAGRGGSEDVGGAWPRSARLRTGRKWSNSQW